MATEVVQGAQDLHTKLRELERKVANKLQRQGTRLGTKVFADEVKRRVPVDSGLLRSAITVRALKRKKGRVGYRVTINTTAKGGRTKAAKAKREAGGFFTTSKSGKKHFYPAIVEYGAKRRPAQAPMRKSFDAKKGQALDTVIESIREGIREATGK